MSENNSDSHNDVLFVDTQDKLSQLCNIIKDSSYLILDTEFVREKTYRAKLCLIQIATDNIIACVDPIVLPDLQPLMDIIYDEKKLKILHSARQDYEIFFDLNNKLPRPLFDSQIAASLLGYGEQVGYAALVSKLLNVQLDKAHTRTDWSKRPLSPAQIRYASDDVLYLRQLYPELKKQLIQQGREEWLQDEFETLCQADLYITLPEEAWKRVKGINRLRPRQLAAAINIAKWREDMAINKDRPRRWILSDDILLAIAQLLPENITQLETIATINKSFIEKSGNTIIKCVEDALNLNESELPEIKIPKRLTAEQEVIADLLMTQVKLVAHEQKISAANICNRKTIEKIISGDNESPLLKGWRYKLAGEKIQKLLSGKYCLCIENNNVSLKEK